MELTTPPSHGLKAFHIPYPIYPGASQLGNQGVANELYPLDPALIIKIIENRSLVEKIATYQRTLPMTKQTQFFFQRLRQYSKTKME